MHKKRYHQKNGFKKQHTIAYYNEHKTSKSKVIPYVENYATSEDLEVFLYAIKKSKDFICEVANHFSPSSDEYQIALLHTVIKDKICNVDTLQLLKVRPSIIEAIIALTPIAGEAHSKYITRISRIPKAETVYKYIGITNRKDFYEKVNDTGGTSTNNGSVLQPKTS